MKFLLNFNFLITACSVNSQLQNNNWIFGYGARVNFSATSTNTIQIGTNSMEEIPDANFEF
jgi:hypothetical protein